MFSSTVLCHEKPGGIHPSFFCTHECQGPYRQHMLDCDLELREAARATSAAPSYFEPMIIRGRSFVDGGFGETNNPSWEGKLHYHMNHDLSEEQRLVMVNIGTGTLPAGIHERELPKRPWWTKLLPNGLVQAFGLVSDLAKMATESEHRAIELAYISSRIPDQFFFQRFSADTGIHDIKLDNWRAVQETDDSPSEIEVKTKAYLEKPEIRARMELVARHLADVYVARSLNHSPSSEVVVVDDASSSVAVEDKVTVDLSISLAIDGTLPGRHSASLLSRRQRRRFLTPAAAAAGDERAPSLVSSSEPTRSHSPSPPPTPEPARRSPLLVQPIITVQAEEVLQGEGGQFEPHKTFLPSPDLHSSSSSTHSLTRRPKRASTYPPVTTRTEDE